MYKLSNDYSKAYKDLYVGGFLICFVDFRFRGELAGEEPSRDICRCKLKMSEIVFTARGIEYGSVEIKKKMSDSEIQTAFEKECKRMNAAFVLF